LKTWRYRLLTFSLVLWVVSYFLASVSQINTYPTYLISVAVLFLTACPETKSLLVNNRNFLLVIAVFLAYLAISAIWSGNQFEFKLLKYAGYAALTFCFVLGTAILFEQTPTTAYWFLIIMSLSAVVSATYSIWLHYALPDFRPLLDNRLYALGRMHSPTISAYSYALALIVMVYLVFSNISWQIRTFWVLASAPVIMAILLTGTRSVALALPFAALIACLAMPGWKTSQKLKVSLGIIFLGALAITLLLQTNYAEILTGRAFSFRPEIWMSVLAKFEGADWRYWLFGFGISANEQVVFGSHHFDHAHNLHLATFYYGGAVGLALFELILVLLLLRIIQARTHPYQTLCLGLLTFSSVILMLDGNRVLEKSNILWLLFWLPAAITLSITNKIPSLVKPGHPKAAPSSQ